MRSANRTIRPSGVSASFGPVWQRMPSLTSNVKFIAHNAVLDACTSSNPRTIDDKTMEKLLVCTYYGNDVEL